MVSAIHTLINFNIVYAKYCNSEKFNSVKSNQGYMGYKKN